VIDSSLPTSYGGGEAHREGDLRRGIAIIGGDADAVQQPGKKGQPLLPRRLEPGNVGAGAIDRLRPQISREVGVALRNEGCRGVMGSVKAL